MYLLVLKALTVHVCHVEPDPMHRWESFCAAPFLYEIFIVNATQRAEAAAAGRLRSRHAIKT